MTATALTVFHPFPDDAGFSAWLAEVLACARAADGFRVARESAREDPLLEPAMTVTFHTEEALHRWLDSPGRAAVMREGRRRGFAASTSDLVFVEGDPLPPGLSVFLQTVAAGREAEFTAAQAELAAKAATFPGCEGTAVFPPGDRGEWLSVVRFRRPHQLRAWLGSGSRAEALPAVRDSLTDNFSVHALTTPYGSTVRTDNGRTQVTPGWKVAMLVLLVLYPTVMLLSRFLGPMLAGLGIRPWLAFFMSNIVSIVVMQWALMPVASRLFGRWLDPVDGAGLRVSVGGAVLIVLGYLAALTLFATVHDLQFWDYAD
ncbi:antibiotic biosynthesis monooxygenase [Mycolicibacterium palauense]|uniref:antibiotic biosynthesis monooxygenase n=1 Tax=Mycolicibacterium palauense TaxID=2034511 RepID=UPI000BFEED09|nr:antibiotic biosynthesis monooxygenase [Mycolicibacterium palauense]